jgi:hypothetical protein
VKLTELELFRAGANGVLRKSWETHCIRCGRAAKSHWLVFMKPESRP